MEFTNIREDFPLLARTDVVYLDNAATSQKPRQVLDAINNYYQTSNANVNRGVHQLADASTEALTNSRKTISQFFGAQPEELILTRNTTEAINGVAYGWADHNLNSGDVILASLLEHHSNLVVWQQVCKRTGAELQLVAVTEDGQLDLEDFRKKIAEFGDKVKLVGLVHVSNTTGAVTPVEKIVKIIAESRLNQLNQPPRLVLDGAQSAPHLPINFSLSSPSSLLGADFYAFSGHKMLGPMGSGGLLVRRELLESGEMQPWLFGGGMISEVYPDHTIFHHDLTDRFTAGTPDVASAVGLAAACDYLATLGRENILEHDRELVDYALSELSKNPKIKIIGPLQSQDNAGALLRSGSVAFLYEKVHSHDVAQVLDSVNVAVRSGHHCTMPLHSAMGWTATTRLSFQVYNNQSDINALNKGLEKVATIFQNVQNV